MTITSLSIESFDHFVVVGDRVLIKPRTADQQTASGLFLPPGVQQGERTYSGYVVKTSPGYPVPAPSDDIEPWKAKDPAKYFPLQARVGDLAIYLQREAYELTFNGETYVVVSHSSILLLIRDEGLLA